MPVAMTRQEVTHILRDHNVYNIEKNSGAGKRLGVGSFRQWGADIASYEPDLGQPYPGKGIGDWNNLQFWPRGKPAPTESPNGNPQYRDGLALDPEMAYGSYAATFAGRCTTSAAGGDVQGTSLPFLDMNLKADKRYAQSKTLGLQEADDPYRPVMRQLPNGLASMAPPPPAKEPTQSIDRVFVGQWALGEERHENRTVASPLPNWPAIYVAGTEWQEQHPIMLPAWTNCLISEYSTKGDLLESQRMSTRIADVTSDLKSVDPAKIACISSALRVAGVIDGFGRSTALAWQIPPGVALAGRGQFSTSGWLGSSTPRKNTPPEYERPPTTEPQRPPTSEPMGPQASVAPPYLASVSSNGANSNSSLSKAAASNSPYGSQTTTDAPRTAEPSVAPPQDTSKSASIRYGYAGESGGGPIGVGGCGKHKVGQDQDGVDHFQGHLMLQAPWYSDPGRDGPPLLDMAPYDKTSTTPEFGVWVDTHMRFDSSVPHGAAGPRFQGGGAFGVWRWQTKIPILPPKDGWEPDDGEKPFEPSGGGSGGPSSPVPPVVPNPPKPQDKTPVEPIPEPAPDTQGTPYDPDYAQELFGDPDAGPPPKPDGGAPKPEKIVVPPAGPWGVGPDLVDYWKKKGKAFKKKVGELGGDLEEWLRRQAGDESERWRKLGEYTGLDKGPWEHGLTGTSPYGEDLLDAFKKLPLMPTPIPPLYLPNPWYDPDLPWLKGYDKVYGPDGGHSEPVKMDPGQHLAEPIEMDPGHHIMPYHPAHPTIGTAMSAADAGLSGWGSIPVADTHFRGVPHAAFTHYVHKEETAAFTGNYRFSQEIITETRVQNLQSFVRFWNEVQVPTITFAPWCECDDPRYVLSPNREYQQKALRAPVSLRVEAFGAQKACCDYEYTQSPGSDGRYATGTTNGGIYITCPERSHDGLSDRGDTSSSSVVLSREVSLYHGEVVGNGVSAGTVTDGWKWYRDPTNNYLNLACVTSGSLTGSVGFQPTQTVFSLPVMVRTDLTVLQKIYLDATEIVSSATVDRVQTLRDRDMIFCAHLDDAAISGTVSGATFKSYRADTSSAPVIINLPAVAAANAGDEIEVIDSGGNSSAQPVTINRAGSDLIRGSTSYVINTDYGTVRLRSDGTSKWHVIAQVTT